MPAVPFEACKKASARVSSLSLVRFDDNDYSVPVSCARHKLVVKGFVDEVRIFKRAGEEVARHVRHWGKEKPFYDPRHYFPLLEHKPGALDHAAPFANLELPPCFDDLRRRLEAGYGHQGTKDFIGVPRLLDKQAPERVARAVEKAVLVCQHPTVEVVRQYLYGDERPEAAVFRINDRPQLAGVRVQAPDLSRYGELVKREDPA